MQNNKTITETFQDIIFAARTGDYGKAASDLNTVLLMLQEELSKGKMSVEGLEKLSYSLETLMSMQQMENWVALADILEYEFVPLWKKLNSK